MQGLFISVEGVEGSGKTTTVQFIADELKRYKAEVIVTAEPGGTSLGDQIRTILLSEDDLPPLSEAFLFFSNRADHVAKVIHPALQRGAIVVCDRYAYSTFAYQSFGLGLDLNLLVKINSIATGGLMPDLTLLLDVDPIIGLERVRQRTAFERRSLPFHQRVRWGYLWLANCEPHKIKIIDASLPLGKMLEQVKSTLWEVVEKWRWQTSSEMNTQ